MKALLLKPTMLVMVMLCMMESVQGNYINNYPQNKVASFGGHIGVVGDFLIGDTGDPNIEIEEVTLLGELNYSTPGCYKRTCSFNVSNVVKGTYEATLHGTGGYKFTRYVSIR